MKALLWLPFVLLAVACNGSTSTPEVQGITPDELLARPPQGAVVLDVRSAGEFASGHVPDAINIPHTELATRLPEIGAASDTPVVVYCESGKRAGIAADVLLEAGYSQVFHLAGDMKAWRAAGRPTASGAGIP